MITRTGDLFAAFVAGMVVLALLLRGIEKHIVVVEQSNGEAEEAREAGHRNASTPDKIRELRVKTA